MMYNPLPNPHSLKAYLDIVLRAELESITELASLHFDPVPAASDVETRKAAGPDPDFKNLALPASRVQGQPLRHIAWD